MFLRETGVSSANNKELQTDLSAWKPGQPELISIQSFNFNYMYILSLSLPKIQSCTSEKHILLLYSNFLQSYPP